MTSTSKDRARMRRRLTGAGALAALAVLATATSTMASTPPGSDETTTTAPAETTPTVPAETTPPDGTTPSTDDATSTSTADSATTAASATTVAPTGFAAVLAEQCEGDTGHQLLASGLQVVMGDDGSLRIVEIVLTCDIEFVGDVDPELGRPSTNVEALIADPANNVTPNQAQTDLLNEELASYWRITDAWVQSQSGTPTTTSAAGATTTAPSEASAPVADVATSGPAEPATTGG